MYRTLKGPLSDLCFGGTAWGRVLQLGTVGPFPLLFIEKWGGAPLGGVALTGRGRCPDR